MTRFATRVAALALFIPMQAVAGDYSAVLREATAALANDYMRDWAFTETSLDSESATVARFDPARSGNEQWQLLTVNGRSPTDEEIADFLDDKVHDMAEEDDDGDSGKDVAELVQPESLSLVEESADHWLFSFIPSEDEFDQGFAEHVDGTLKVARDSPYVEFINIQSKKPFRPQFGVKISEFATQLAFGPAAADGPIVPLAIDIRIKARAFLAIGIDEMISISFSDYEYVGD